MHTIPQATAPELSVFASRNIADAIELLNGFAPEDAAAIAAALPLERAIVDGRGRVQIADAYWEVAGPELPAGTHVRIVGGDAMSLQVEPA